MVARRSRASPAALSAARQARSASLRAASARPSASADAALRRSATPSSSSISARRASTRAGASRAASICGKPLLALAAPAGRRGAPRRRRGADQSWRSATSASSRRGAAVLLATLDVEGGARGGFLGAGGRCGFAGGGELGAAILGRRDAGQRRLGGLGLRGEFVALGLEAADGLVQRLGASVAAGAVTGQRLQALAGARGTCDLGFAWPGSRDANRGLRLGGAAGGGFRGARGLRRRAARPRRSRLPALARRARCFRRASAGFGAPALER